MYLTIISMLIIAAYTVAVCVKQKGIPYSISATFYKLDHPYWFMATMWLTAGVLMPVILEVSKPDTEWMVFIACTGMFLVGAAPNFKDGFEGKVHTAGAVLCLAGSQLWVIFNCPWALMIWLVWLVYTVIYMSRHVSDSIISDFLRVRPMFWVEVVALVTTYLAIFLK
ncbi:glycosyl transferase [Parabacteroides johnsonii]|uniref:glycosyl transferase n=1 Tax=Parabacteroides johnsonii TaxID=387661 RepID=UPI0011DD9DD7|nr:glycosyl transferase [Parabacteroides johnsonii]